MRGSCRRPASGWIVRYPPAASDRPDWKSGLFPDGDVLVPRKRDALKMSVRDSRVDSIASRDRDLKENTDPGDSRHGRGPVGPRKIGRWGVDETGVLGQTPACSPYPHSLPWGDEAGIAVDAIDDWAIWMAPQYANAATRTRATATTASWSGRSLSELTKRCSNGCGTRALTRVLRSLSIRGRVVCGSKWCDLSSHEQTIHSVLSFGSGGPRGLGGL
jgi:hypothetical protein